MSEKFTARQLFVYRKEAHSAQGNMAVFMQQSFRLLQLRHPRYAYKNMGNLIPGTEVDDAGLREAEDGLEGHHGPLGGWSEDAVGVDSGNIGIDCGDGI